MWAPQVPMQLLVDSILTDADRILIIALLSHIRQEDGRYVCWPSNARLCELTAKPMGTVKRILWKLRLLNYIRSATPEEAEVHDVPYGKRDIVLDLPYTEGGFRGETGFTGETSGVSEVKPGREQVEETQVNGSVKPPSKPSVSITKVVDAVVEHLNGVTGRRYKTGSARSKAITDLIRNRYKELMREHDDHEKALMQLKVVCDEKMIQTKERSTNGMGQKFSEEWVRPSTLYRPTKFVEYLEEAKHRARKEGRVVWLSSSR